MIKKHTDIKDKAQADAAAAKKANEDSPAGSSPVKTANFLLSIYTSNKEIIKIQEKYEGVQRERLTAVATARRDLHAHTKAVHGVIAGDADDSDGDIDKPVKVEPQSKHPLSPQWLLARLVAANIFSCWPGSFSQHQQRLQPTHTHTHSTHTHTHRHARTHTHTHSVTHTRHSTCTRLLTLTHTRTQLD